MDEAKEVSQTVARLRVAPHGGFPFTDLKLGITLYNVQYVYFSLGLVRKFSDTHYACNLMRCSFYYGLISKFARTVVSQLYRYYYI